MADRIEREIEEILSKFDEKEPKRGTAGPEREPAREPIPLRPRRKKSAASRIATATPALPVVTPATLLFAGAGIMIGGLILASFVDALIWIAFAGVVLFLGAFVWSFMRRTTPGTPAGSAGGPKGAYWRDRYVEYDTTQGPGSIERFKRVFRRK